MYLCNEKWVFPLEKREVDVNSGKIGNNENFK